MAVLAIQGPAMNPQGWQARLAADLRHWADVTMSGLDALPGWVFAVLIFAAIAALVRVGAHQYLDRAEAAAHPPGPDAPPRPPEPALLGTEPDQIQPTPIGDPVGETTS